MKTTFNAVEIDPVIATFTCEQQFNKQGFDLRTAFARDWNAASSKRVYATRSASALSQTAAVFQRAGPDDPYRGSP